MPTLTDAPDELAAAHTLAGRYCKEYHAGAFAWPSRGEMLQHPDRIRVASDRGTVTGMAIVRRYDRSSTRKDFTGASFTLPTGAVVATHLAVTPGSSLPVDGCTHVTAYAEDAYAVAKLTERGYRPWKHIITPSSALLTVFALNPTGPALDPADRATVAPMRVPPPPLTRMLNEIQAAQGMYHDDNPFYNTGDWSQAALRGYNAHDPGVGFHPAEMNKAWKAANPGWKMLRPEWTPLAVAMRATRRWLDSIPWATHFDRVRLLRLTPGGTLKRHSDMSGRWNGTADGLIARFQMPLITDPATTMTWWELDGQAHTAHLQPGVLYYHDSRKPHEVHNNATTTRIQLCIDVVSDAKVRAAITEAAAA